MNTTLQQRAREYVASEPVDPLGYIRAELRLPLLRWLPERPRPPGSDELAYSSVSAVVALYDDALAKLKGKTGPRADAARTALAAARAPLVEKLALADALRIDFSGPLGLDLQKRIVATRANLRKAFAAREVATRDTIEEALLEIERCYADSRELARDLDAIKEKLSVPSPPNIEVLLSAETTTRDLESVSAKQVRAAHVHAAIEIGLKAPAHLAALWIAYERDSEHSLLAWRWRAYAERAP